MELARNITKNIINVLCVILFIILLLVIYAKVTVTFSNDIHANYFGYRILEVASGSMEPTINKNDVLLVKVNDQNLNKDDIIAYQQEDAIITHRIVMIDNDNLIVKGDANNTVDAPIKKEQVIGKIVKIYPKLGIWKKILTEPKILILIFATLLLFDAALSYNGKDKKKKVDLPKKKEELIEETKEETKVEVPLLKEEISDEPLIKEEKEDEIHIEEEENNEPLIKEEEVPSLIVTDIEKEELDDINAKEIDEYLDDNEEEIEPIDEDDEKTDYTIRLDLNEIQKNINKSVK